MPAHLARYQISVKQISSQCGLLDQFLINFHHWQRQIGWRREMRTLAVPSPCLTHGKLLAGLRFPDFTTWRATARAEGGSVAWHHWPSPLPRERRTACTHPGAFKDFPQRPRKHFHWESLPCVDLWGANKFFYHGPEKCWAALSGFAPQNYAHLAKRLLLC